MALTENIDIFFSDFGNSVVSGGARYKGILEQPDELIADGVVLTTDYELIAKNSELGSLAFDAQISIDNSDYKVRNVRKIDDGTLSVISLMKVWDG